MRPLTLLEDLPDIANAQEPGLGWRERKREVGEEVDSGMRGRILVVRKEGEKR